jgi:hypothetical protein
VSTPRTRRWQRIATSSLVSKPPDRQAREVNCASYETSSGS